MSSTMKPLNTPVYSPTTFNVATTGSEFMVVMARNLPATDAIGPQDSVGNLLTGMVVEPLGSLLLSPQAAKDLLIVLQRAVESHEDDFGKIITPFARAKSEPT